MRHTTLLITLFALLNLPACARKEANPHSEVHLKIAVKVDGSIFVDGIACDQLELSRRLDSLKKMKGTVWFYTVVDAKDAPDTKANRAQGVVLKLVTEKQLPMEFAVKEDFSERMIID